MDAKEVKSKLNLEMIIELLEELGAEPKQSSNLNEIWCKTICHNGDSHKLYLYKDSLSFHCYTHCGSLDILEIIKNVLGYSLSQAIEFICTRFGFYSNSFKFGFDNTVYSKDLDIANSFQRKNQIIKQEEWKPFKVLDESILNEFYNFYHESFYGDGISPYVLGKFEIKFDILNNRVIIPHRNVNGDLIAIRCRNLDEDMVNNGKKYMPIVVNNKLLSAPTGQYFFGLYQNIENIKLCKKVILVESEKAVMQYETMFPNANICLALSSSNLSNFQIDILKNILGVEEVILALDKEFEIAGTEEEFKYARKLKKTIIDRLNFCRVSILWDTRGLLKMKDSPLDRGKEVFNELYINRRYMQQ